MKLSIDILDGSGLRDYTGYVSADKLPVITRKLNEPAVMKLGLVGVANEVPVPSSGARLVLTRNDGDSLFTGYQIQSAHCEYLGWGDRGPIYRYELLAKSDDVLMQAKSPAKRSFFGRTVGSIIKCVVQDLCPGQFGTTSVADLEVVSEYEVDGSKTWQQITAELGLRARASVRTLDGNLIVETVGSRSLVLDESASLTQPAGLDLLPCGSPINSVTVLGATEPDLHVKDYFCGDGYTLSFSLSATPFGTNGEIIVEQEYTGTALDPKAWTVVDPSSVCSMNSGRLWVQGGTGSLVDSQIVLNDDLGLAGALVLQHGDVIFSAPSDGIIGGLYSGPTSVAACIAGFRITPSGSNSQISALIDGATAGSSVTTVAGHHYVMKTRIFSTEAQRWHQSFHSSKHPTGNAIGGDAVVANCRVVLEVHDIDPNNVSSQSAASIVLYDGLLTAVPDSCSYALVSAASMQCGIAYTCISKVFGVEVRRCIPGQSFQTMLVGDLSTGSQCTISSKQLRFYAPYVAPSNTAIVAAYRSKRQSFASQQDFVSIASTARGLDNGVRSAFIEILDPPASCSEDCTNAAQAFLDDAAARGWTGTYRTSSELLPASTTDIFPGDTVEVDSIARNAAFTAVIREVTVETKHLAAGLLAYTLQFANETVNSLGLKARAATTKQVLALPQINSSATLASLSEATMIAVSSTSVTLDMGIDPPAAGGFEIRSNDSGWSPLVDRNLIGRFSTRQITIPRLSRIQDYYIRQYDQSATVQYSRHSALIHIDYPM